MVKYEGAVIIMNNNNNNNKVMVKYGGRGGVRWGVQCSACLRGLRRAEVLQSPKLNDPALMDRLEPREQCPAALLPTLNDRHQSASWGREQSAGRFVANTN